MKIGNVINHIIKDLQKKVHKLKLLETLIQNIKAVKSYFHEKLDEMKKNVSIKFNLSFINIKKILVKKKIRKCLIIIMSCI